MMVIIGLHIIVFSLAAFFRYSFSHACSDFGTFKEIGGKGL